MRIPLFVTLLMTIACVFASPTSAADARSYAAGKFVLNVEGVLCGFVKGVAGGDIDAGVIEEQGGTFYVKKHLGPVRYGDFSLQTGLGEFAPVNAWIEQTLDGKHARRDGSVVADEFDFVDVRRNFFSALLTEIGFPACDVSAKDFGDMTLTFRPETTKWLPDSGDAAQKPPRPSRPWRRSDFQLSIPGLDCSKIATIDSLTVKQSVQRDDIGDARDYALEPGKIECPNLVVTMPDSTAQSWLAWHKSFVIDGKNDDANEKTGTLVFLSQNRVTALCTITFFNLGIFSISSDDPSSNDDKVHHMKVKMYCERMSVSFHDDSDKDNKPPKANGTLINP